ncbi:hypothetical protein ANN_25439 [Periplaneta americana]|uniref:Ionotropic glutamate receptor C-terminal domain-containing protein n=1 Tax=Periplaneta americana TaxID=6978 RepID=A0ABQ8S1J2_PERAM|nr:hypothetical protein ANN_25439 [Periplaneta americana]
MYSNQELAEIHFMYGKADGNAALARRLYQERYPQRQCPDRKTFVRLHYRLCEYGKFNSPGLGRGRQRSTTPEIQEEILEVVNMTPSISTRRVALQVNVPHTTVWRLLKEYQLYPYHLQRVQALSPADYPARVSRFCQWFLEQCGVNPNFPALVLFTDEAQFTRDGITNIHNQHVWAYENPRATVPSHHQVRFSLNMWAGIIGDRLFGPHVLVNRLTGQAYTKFLENTIPHVLEKDTPLINRQYIHFLDDGAPAHFSRTARRYLDRRFPDRWIGRGGPIAWPPRSPDLNPLDFYLWGHLKSLVYSSPVPDLESLRNRIVACSEDIRNTPGVWDRVRRSMRHRCEVCIQAGGGHFEHLLTEYTESESFGSRDNDGSWNGMMALVSKNDVDIGLGDFTLTAERRAAVDFLEPVHVSSIKVFIQLVDRADLIWHSYLVPFSSGLWAAVVASMLLLSLCLSLAANHADSRGQHNTYENFLYVFGSLCQQGQADIVRSSSGRIVSLTAYVTSLVLFAGYSASLISSVTVQSRVLPFTNLPGMLRDGSYRMGVVVNTSYFDIFSEATRDPERAVYNKLIVPYMKDLPKATPEGFRRICSEKKLAFITSELLGLYLSEHSPCVMTTIPEISYSETLTFIISKRNPFKKLINWNLGRIRETGLQNRIRKTNIPGKSDDGRESTKSVEVTAIAPILVILTAGHIVAFLMLLIERKFHTVRIKKRPGKQARS